MYINKVYIGVFIYGEKKSVKAIWRIKRVKIEFFAGELKPDTFGRIESRSWWIKSLRKISSKNLTFLREAAKILFNRPASM